MNNKKIKNKRFIDKQLQKHFTKYKQALILLGARQVGKTTALKRLFPKATYLLVDEQPIKDALETYSMQVYKQIIGDARQIIIDELHLISNPGRAVKILYDNNRDLQIIVTGSSSLHIKNKTGESMAGRSIFYKMHPLMYSEYLYQTDAEKNISTIIFDNILQQNSTETFKKYDKIAVLNNILLYGLYPNTINLAQDIKYLKNLAETAIFKDIIELNLIDNRAKAEELLRLLAYQIGNLINYGEIANKLGISANTVRRYIDIFEQSFLVYRLYPFTRNKRSEIGKMPKIYFWDTGLRNAIINNFDEIHLRSDSGALFENFIINEVRKIIDYIGSNYKINYWRTRSGSEVNLILSHKDEIIACEIKMQKGKISIAFKNRYPEAKTHIITENNFM